MNRSVPSLAGSVEGGGAREKGRGTRESMLKFSSLSQQNAFLVEFIQGKLPPLNAETRRQIFQRVGISNEM